MFSAGYDLYSAESNIVKKHERNIISTDIIIEIPTNTYGRIASRSGLAFNYGIEVGAGVIDSDYRGEIKILLHNHSDHNFKIKRGDKIA